MFNSKKIKKLERENSDLKCLLLALQINLISELSRSPERVMERIKLLKLNGWDIELRYNTKISKHIVRISSSMITEEGFNALYIIEYGDLSSTNMPENLQMRAKYLMLIDVIIFELFYRYRMHYLFFSDRIKHIFETSYKEYQSNWDRCDKVEL